MKYISTRGVAPELNFEEVLLAGLASDGGLYVPKTLPKFSREDFESWKGLAYDELAFEILKPFVDDSIPPADFKAILKDTYATFSHADVAPLVPLQDNEWVLELFHGPTLAFKDFALQLLGRLLDYVLERRDQRVVILGATSGDTGSAAIEGCKRCSNVDIFILHPHNRVSDVQRRQMTTVVSEGVHNIALEGNFDDCQNIVKTSFGDQSFLSGGRSLVAVNSINWARIMAQIVYYVYAALKLGAPEKAVSFSVPTGNFGDIFAGYLAKQMGLPIDDLIIATNRNNVLHDALHKGEYTRKTLHKTLSPSMDISISSNFERLLFDLYGRDGAVLKEKMAEFEREGLRFSESETERLKSEFSSASIDDDETCKLIASVFSEKEYLLDPHSATGVGAARKCRKSQDQQIVCLATAHPAKFPEAIEQSRVDTRAKLPIHMVDLFEREEKFTVLANDLETVNQFMAESVR